jgi:hypothetical protein
MGLSHCVAKKFPEFPYVMLPKSDQLEDKEEDGRAVMKKYFKRIESQGCQS